MSRGYLLVRGSPDEVADQLTRLHQEGRTVFTADGHPIVLTPFLTDDGSVAVYVLVDRGA